MSKKPFNTISFYRYVTIGQPDILKEELRKQCWELKILGRILVGKEGINGAVSGRETSIIAFKQELQKLFPGLTFREQPASTNSYHKLVIRVKKEICVFGQDVNLNNIGTHLPASELEQWYKENKEFTIVDARNDYEYDVGHFKNAIKMPIKYFREFSTVAPKVLKEKKEETIVLYCTGGVRCEKASAYLKSQGFKDVYQVEGGVINYTTKFSQNWEGSLFVFDDRLVEEGEENINRCLFCQKKTDKYTNCYNLDCDKLFISCPLCLEKMKNTCSEECKESPRQREMKKNKELIGRVENYYPKAQVALVRFQEEILPLSYINIDKELHFKGKTTDFSQKINGIQWHEEHLATFPVREKVRKNDSVLI